MTLNSDRYSRQILFSGVGADGQARLRAARVVIVGCGALGCLQAETLARAGVGFLRLIDRDFIEASNLQRQVLFDEAAAAERLPKAVAAKRRLANVNSDVEIEAVVADVHADNIERLIADADLVLDGTDNFETRYLLNDACVKRGVPWIYGAAVGAFGLTMTVLPGVTPCLRCVFDEPPAPGVTPTCDTAGIILPAIAAVVAAQTAEALKLLSGRREKLRGTLLQIDLWENSYRNVKLAGLRESGDCVCCRHRTFEFLDAGAAASALTLCGRNAVQIRPARAESAPPLDLPAVAARLRAVGDVKLTDHLILFRADGCEMTVFRDARAIIKGVGDPNIARSLYAKYLGT
jgi:adenylyltransferase/sulfurtransferase